MPIDLLAKFSVTEKVINEEGRELFDMFLAPGENILLYYRHARDKVIFTDRKIIAIDIQGITGKKKEFRMFPYSKITSFSVETAGTFDWDSDLKIWVSGVGVFGVKLGKKIDIAEVGVLLSEKVK
ncbi:PH domain-containing protein [Antarcticibacterium flavum]|uniref:PH domain-containing protein n=1 Tax=Antarcticibacterium flavum TaxID=2058175 RepID=A0A5B7X3V9_9FLAO|nr:MULTISPECIES: PH domain-containing protein [Antarcticibacterium]MCM4161106.1 PH domain-containing protein [Antarcticibacterium sp. W02-3]QCY69391.1 PH domain-containing protein [Antarcticibacterium flavum]